VNPFSESARYEQNNSSDGFFASGSAGSVGNLPGTFSTGLANKEHVKISFEVKRSVYMIPNSSSIYYYNAQNNQWNVPTGSIRDIVGPFQKYSIPTKNWANLYVFSSPEDEGTVGSNYIEDAKGFDYLGRPVFSGSLDIYRQEALIPNQSSELIGSNYVSTAGKDVVPYMLENYRKSIQRSPQYKASSDEVFKPALDRPFLLEKAVIEIPIAMGATWFQDRTITGVGYSTGSYAGSSNNPIDQSFYISTGGPCLTVSLMCQKNYGIETIRDLILSGTITHEQDSQLRLFARKLDFVTQLSAGGGGTVQAKHVVIETNGVKSPSYIVSKNLQSQFTGSVLIKAESSISNGAVGAIVSVNLLTGSSPTKVASFAAFTPEGFLSETIRRMEVPKISTNYSSNNAAIPGRGTWITGLDPFGRGMTGFSPSGGSIFGGEYATSNFDLFAQGASFDNPTYVSSSTLRSEIINQISSTIASQLDTIGVPYPDSYLAYVHSVYETPVFQGSKTSPYLLNPGDELLLTISKTRPAISMSYNDVPDESSAQFGISSMKYSKMLTGSIAGHEVCLMTGSINITLYVSYVREGNSYRP